MTAPERAWLLALDAPDGTDRDAACAADTLAKATDYLGPGPVRWAVDVACTITREVIEQVPAHGGGPAPIQTLQRAVESTVLMSLVALRLDQRVPPSVVAPEALDANTELTRRGIPLDRVLRGVRIGHAVLHHELMAAVEAPSDDLRVAEMKRVSDRLFAYADMHTSRLAEEYIAERERWRHGTESARRRMVENLLLNRRVDPDEAMRVLGYDLDRHHLAFIVWAATPESTAENCHRFAAQFAQAASADRLLTVPAGPSRMWAWAAWASSPPPDVVADSHQWAAPPEELCIATGPVAHGTQGFRRSHLGAVEAERISRTGLGLALLDYADIRVASLLTKDVEHATWFTRETLGALCGDGERLADLRTTLRVYLAEGRSPQRAADQLHINRNTVTYRARQAEELLPQPAARYFEVWLALEAERVLRLGAQEEP
ncbi:PucR family transcriptional regulator [Streptomyces sp. NPDC006285]|uniref:PucR family transcriptional regulator n=1 Tax=Streptomyces sp. NPDC006285 TaxID=3364742 RepID=UPI0036961C30